jgi:hypothetical protein
MRRFGAAKQKLRAPFDKRKSLVPNSHTSTFQPLTAAPSPPIIS